MYEFEQAVDLSALVRPFDLISGLDDDTLFISDYGHNLLGNDKGAVHKLSLAAGGIVQTWDNLPRPMYLSISQAGNVFVTTGGDRRDVSVPWNSNPSGPGSGIWKCDTGGGKTWWWPGEAAPEVIDPDNPFSDYDNVFATHQGDSRNLYGPMGLAVAPDESAAIVTETEYNWFGAWSLPAVALVVQDFAEKDIIWRGHTSINPTFDDLDAFGGAAYGMQLDWDSQHFWFLSDSELTRINVSALGIENPRHPSYPVYPLDTFQRYFVHGVGSPAQAYGSGPHRAVYYATGSYLQRWLPGQTDPTNLSIDVGQMLTDWVALGPEGVRWLNDGVVGKAGQGTCDNVAVTPNGEVYILDATNKKINHVLMSKPGTVQYDTPDLPFTSPPSRYSDPRGADIYYQYFPKSHPSYVPQPGQT